MRKGYTITASVLVVILLLLLFAPNGLVSRLSNGAGKGSAPTTQAGHQFRIIINLKNGRPDKGPFTYSLSKGDTLEFTVTSDRGGSIIVPTTPPQTINFTQSPISFKLTASASGDSQIAYVAMGSQEAVVIGTLHVPN